MTLSIKSTNEREDSLKTSKKFSVDPLLHKICDTISLCSSLPRLTQEENISLYAQGYAFYQQGQYEKGAEIFKILTLHDPMEEKFFKGLASCYQMQGFFEKATESWAICALLDKNDPYPHFHAAECLISLGEKNDAIKALLEAKKRLSTKNKKQLEGKIDLLIQGVFL
ncbi:MAG: SycD/LcrH family type III secretion system chaperone [Parachlamydiales bacterium]|nr:SycD/LcrH family type III secretion system chaperone [Parachlamydiales bacterium]